jgi:hypothetical protein
VSEAPSGAFIEVTVKMEAVHILTQRPLIVALAIGGAVLVMAAGHFSDRNPLRAAHLSKAGYAVTFASIALFIVAGFLSGR